MNYLKDEKIYINELLPDNFYRLQNDSGMCFQIKYKRHTYNKSAHMIYIGEQRRYIESILL